MVEKDDLREAILEAKEEKGLTWEQIASAINRSPVYAAMLCYGYGAATAEEASALINLLGLPAEARGDLMAAPHRTPVQPWPPTDPFVYRFYEVILLYGPVLKDVCHEMFGDGIMSAIDFFIDIKKVKGEEGEDRAQISFDGKWLVYRKF